MRLLNLLVVRAGAAALSLYSLSCGDFERIIRLGPDMPRQQRHPHQQREHARHPRRQPPRPVRRFRAGRARLAAGSALRLRSAWLSSRSCAGRRTRLQPTGHGCRHQPAPDQFVRAELEAARARKAVPPVRLVIRPLATERQADQLRADHQPHPRAEDPAPRGELPPDGRRLASGSPSASAAPVPAPGRPATGRPIFRRRSFARTNWSARLTVGCSRDAGPLNCEPSQAPAGNQHRHQRQQPRQPPAVPASDCPSLGLASGSRIAPNGQDASHNRHCVQ